MNDKPSYYERNRERILARCKERYRLNAEQIKASLRARYEADKDAFRKASLAWYHRNKEIVAARRKQKRLEKQNGEV